MRMQKIRILPRAAVALSVVLLSMTGCYVLDPSTWGDNAYSASEEFEFDLQVTTQTAFSLRGINGSVEIFGDPDATAVSVTGVKRVESHSEADALDQLDRLDVEVTTNTDGFAVETDQPRNTDGRNFIVNYTVVLPAGMELRAETTNGEVLVEEMRNLVVAETTNGAVSLCGVTGDAVLETTNGNIFLSEFRGSVWAGTTNGGVNGDVVLPENGECRLSTTNGNIDLDLPAGTSAEFSARLSNGDISVSGLTLTDLETSRRTVTGTLNGGGGVIDLRTTNGNIDVRGY